MVSSRKTHITSDNDSSDTNNTPKKKSSIKKNTQNKPNSKRQSNSSKKRLTRSSASLHNKKKTSESALVEIDSATKVKTNDMRTLHIEETDSENDSRNLPLTKTKFKKIADQLTVFTSTLKQVNLRLSRIEETFMILCGSKHDISMPSVAQRFIVGDIHDSGFRHSFSYGDIVCHCGHSGTIVKEELNDISFETSVNNKSCILTIEKKHLGCTGKYMVFQRNIES